MGPPGRRGEISQDFPHPGCTSFGWRCKVVASIKTTGCTWMWEYWTMPCGSAAGVGWIPSCPNVIPYHLFCDDSAPHTLALIFSAVICIILPSSDPPSIHNDMAPALHSVGPKLAPCYVSLDPAPCIIHPSPAPFPACPTPSTILHTIVPPLAPHVVGPASVPLAILFLTFMHA